MRHSGLPRRSSGSVKRLPGHGLFAQEKSVTVENVTPNEWQSFLHQSQGAPVQPSQAEITEAPSEVCDPLPDFYQSFRRDLLAAVVLEEEIDNSPRGPTTVGTPANRCCRSEAESTECPE